jgi:hypothetical protein
MNFNSKWLFDIKTRISLTLTRVSDRVLCCVNLMCLSLKLFEQCFIKLQFIEQLIMLYFIQWKIDTCKIDTDTYVWEAHYGVMYILILPWITVANFRKILLAILNMVIFIFQVSRILIHVIWIMIICRRHKLKLEKTNTKNSCAQNQLLSYNSL